MSEQQPAKREKPTHYRVLCVSMYTSDIERMNEIVVELKRRGRTKMTRSELIRIAIAMFDLDRVDGTGWVSR